MEKEKATTAEKETEKGASEKPGSKPIIKKVLGILGDVLLCLVVVIAVFVLVVSIMAKKDNQNGGAASIFGIKMMIVLTPSMEACDKTDVSEFKIKSLKVGTCIFIEEIPEDTEKRKEWLKTIKVGDVLTFKYIEMDPTTPITHRVIEVTPLESGGCKLVLAGDNKNSEDGVLLQTIDDALDISQLNRVIGRVTGQSYLLGLLIYAFQQPIGIVCLILVPCLIMIAFQVMRIIKVLSVEKKEKEATEKATQANEIEELKRQLAALQQTPPATVGQQPQSPPGTGATDIKTENASDTSDE